MIRTKRIIFTVLSLLILTNISCSPGGSIGGNSGSETGTYNISGTVLEALSADELEGVSIEIRKDSEIYKKVSTDTNGKFSADGMPDGTYTLYPAKSGYDFNPVTQAVTINGNNIDDINFTASKIVLLTYSISGTVLEASGGNAIEGVSIDIRDAFGTCKLVNTDASGKFSADGIPDGTYTLYPAKSGYNFNPATRAVTINGNNIDDVNFTASKIMLLTYSISGTVLEASGGNALEGVSIDIRNASGTYKLVNTDASGKFSADGIPDGTYTLYPAKSGYDFSPASQAVTINGNNVDDINFTASKIVLLTYSISGTVLEASGGNAIEGVSIDIRNATGTYRLVNTDASGKFSADGIPDGTYTLYPAKSGYDFSPANKAVTINGNNVSAVNFSASEIVNPGDNEIKIICVGDINLGHLVEEAILDTARGNGDFKYPFYYVADYLNSADITFGNLESVISDQGSDTKKILSTLGYGISLRAKPAAIEGLLYAGFDILNLANNHTGDFGYDALTDSFSILNAAGIKYLGAGNNFAEAHSPVIKEIKGLKIAFLGYANVPMYADITGRSPTHKWIAGGPEIGITEHPGLAWADNTRFTAYGDLNMMQNDIENAKLQADMVIVSVHFGWEYDSLPDLPPHDATMDEQTLAHMAIDAGASLVVGHHPHVVQWLDNAKTTALEAYNGGYIAYSLGNFVFDISSTQTQAPNGEATYGLLLEINIKNGVIDNIKQVKTYYLDNYWQVHLE